MRIRRAALEHDPRRLERTAPRRASMRRGPSSVNFESPSKASTPLPLRAVKVIISIALSTLVIAGCGRKAAPPPPPTEDAARIACDRLAARAIQTADASEAATLTGRAAECYAALP